MTAADTKQEWCDRIRGTEAPLLPVGARTKNALSFAEQDTALLTTNLSGVVAYDPSEFLISAYSGTTVGELNACIREHGQYLPFDPVFVDDGSTLGGTVGSGISGPRQMLFGSLRDFVMEVEFIDGLGSLVRGGGKVVKNAAGFDFPKMMVGSYGRLGVITEVTLKILPQPSAFVELKLTGMTVERFLDHSSMLLSQPLPTDSICLGSDGQMRIEFAGPAEALPSVVSRAQATLALQGDVSEVQDYLTATSSKHRFLDSKPDLMRIATSPRSVTQLVRQLNSQFPNADYELAAGGSLLWLSLDTSSDWSELDTLLKSTDSSGVLVRSSSESKSATDSRLQTDLLTVGMENWRPLARRVQLAMDPNGHFFPF